MKTLAINLLAAAVCVATTATAANVHSAARLNTAADADSSHYMAPPAHAPGSKVIYSNIATIYPKSLYFCCYGYDVAGIKSTAHVQTWSALQFTPTSDAKVTEIDAAAQLRSGSSFIDISLFADAGGQPGALLKTGQAHGMQYVGGCCALAAVSWGRGVPVKANTPYWVAITTDKKGEDTFVTWEFNSTDQINAVPWALNEGSGWQSAGGIAPGMGFAVYGK